MLMTLKGSCVLIKKSVFLISGRGATDLRRSDA
jgi:hypothetical protein